MPIVNLFTETIPDFIPEPGLILHLLLDVNQVSIKEANAARKAILSAGMDMLRPLNFRQVVFCTLKDVICAKICCSILSHKFTPFTMHVFIQIGNTFV